MSMVDVRLAENRD